MRLSHGAAGPELFYRVCLLLREGLYGLNAFPQPTTVLSLAVRGLNVPLASHGQGITSYFCRKCTAGPSGDQVAAHGG